jgi:hypothetical protein
MYQYMAALAQRHAIADFCYAGIGITLTMVRMPRITEFGSTFLTATMSDDV